MSKLEFLLAVLSNMKPAFITLSISSILTSFIFLFALTIDEDEYTKKKYRNYMLFFFPCSLIFTCLASIPSVNDLWEIRIGLIKLELASPENIKKGTEEIVRLGKKLECKYLGCEEENKK